MGSESRKRAKSTTSALDPEGLSGLVAALEELQRECRALEVTLREDVAAVHASYRASSTNLIHYLALRQHDLRDTQRALAERGLSSLGRSEAHVMATLDSVLAVLHRLRGAAREVVSAPPVGFHSGPALLERNAEALLGKPRRGRQVRIMVTMPTEAATDYALVRDLVRSGMDVARINCAHDDRAVWEGMAAHVRRARKEVGEGCRLLVDLAGPKLRTGALAPGPCVLRVRPERDRRGRVVRCARVRLGPPGSEGAGADGADTCLGIDPDVLEQAEAGDRLRLTDASGRERSLRITSVSGGACWAEARKTVRFESRAEVRLKRGGEIVAKGRLGELAPVAEPLVLRVGDRLTLTRSPEPGMGARSGEAGEMLAAARIPCTLPEVFADLRPGERVFFDDGRIGGIIRSVGPDEVEAEITRAAARGSRLRADRGINLPDSHIRLGALAARDLEALDFAAASADAVGMSFVRRPQDVLALEEELGKRGASHLGLLLKIETREAFDGLPRLLLTAMRSPPIGVMVARGDLGVELGFERLAEVQEEILWVCEAGHVPVVWATQVLETLTRTGSPSRAEVTDAAMSGRAECVMLNKGPHVVEAVAFLDNVLRRMHEHQEKKSSLLRKLSVSRVV